MQAQALTFLPRSGAIALGTAIFCNLLGAIAPLNSPTTSLWNQFTAAPAQAQRLDTETWPVIYQQVSPAVVAIQKTDGTPLGSGVVISDDGLIITNRHVVQAVDAADDPVIVCFYGVLDYASACSFLADIISVSDGDSLTSDLAALKIPDFQSSFFIPLRPLTNISQGSAVAAMGSSDSSLANAMTLGIVSQAISSLSAENSPTDYILIQHDAAINPGNSGGPLFNRQGALIGINTARSEAQAQELEVVGDDGLPRKITVQTGRDSENISFAIPTDTVIDFLNRNNIPFETAAVPTEFILNEQGILGADNARLVGDELFQDHLFYGETGDRVSIRLISRDFIPNFSVHSPSGDEIFRSDNNSLSAETLFFLPEDGFYEVRVRARNSVGQGAYLLTVLDGQALLFQAR